MKIAFLDRDGVINKEKNYLYKREDWEYTYNCIDGLRALSSLGFKFIVITNQAGIARGYYSEEDYQKLTDWYVSDLDDKGISILEVFHCPHHPNGKVDKLSMVCDCRKPSPGLLHAALKKYDIDKAESILIGDKTSDIEAGVAWGIPEGNAFLVKTGHELPQHKILNNVFQDLLSVSVELKERLNE